MLPSRKFKIQYGAYKPEVPTSQLIDTSLITCKGCIYVFEVELFTMTIGDAVRHNR